MGGELPPESLFSAVEQAVVSLPPSRQLVVIATPEVAASLPQLSDRMQIEVAEQVIQMSDAPLVAIRTKKQSSLVRGIQLLSERYLDAFVSTGNTGALVASATLTLPRTPGVDRPALLATLPVQGRGLLAVLDVGGTVHVKAEHLVQFARMGAAFQQRRYGIAKPRVGLLNIGEEAEKGTPEHRLAYALLQQEQDAFAFIGNVEGRDAFNGSVDVLVTDGFTGNVFLKTAEGVAAFILEALKAPLAKHSEFQSLASQVDYAQYPGAVLCGVEGLVMKCHGCSSSRALYHGILGASSLIT